MASVGSHHAEDIVSSLVSYNIGVQNREVIGRKWYRKAHLILRDMLAIFESSHGVQVALLSEFGNMYACIDDQWESDTKSFFEGIVREMHNDDLSVFALPPYVALVDSSVWEVKLCEKVFELCDIKGNFAMHLLLLHKASGVVLRLLNCHVPSSNGSNKRKADTVHRLGKLCTTKWEAHGSIWKHTGYTPHWVIAGDLNLDASLLLTYCRDYVEPGVVCLSTSMKDLTDVRKSDIAISQGIALVPVPAWVGVHTQPHATDSHNMVAVTGVIKVTSSGSHSAAVAEVSNDIAVCAPDESNADTYPDVVVNPGHSCATCGRCWKVGEEMPIGVSCDCPARSQLEEGICSSDNAEAGFSSSSEEGICSSDNAVAAAIRGIPLVVDDKIREQLCYAWKNMSELIGAISYIDGKMRTAGLAGPLKDLFEGPLSELLTALKDQQQISFVLTTWAAEEGLNLLPAPATPKKAPPPPPPTLKAAPPQATSAKLATVYETTPPATPPATPKASAPPATPKAPPPSETPKAPPPSETLKALPALPQAPLDVHLSPPQWLPTPKAPPPQVPVDEHLSSPPSLTHQFYHQGEYVVTGSDGNHLAASVSAPPSETPKAPPPSETLKALPALPQASLDVHLSPPQWLPTPKASPPQVPVDEHLSSPPSLDGALECVVTGSDGNHLAANVSAGLPLTSVRQQTDLSLDMMPIDHPAFEVATADESKAVDNVVTTLVQHVHEENAAAQNLLSTIISCKDGRAIRSREQMMELMVEPMRRREAYIDKLARRRGISEPAPGQYTSEEWKNWLMSRPLDDTDMTGALNEWKEDFKDEHFKQKEKVVNYQVEATRQSKQDARKLFRGAFKVELSNRYGRYQLAFSLLKNPASNIDALLQAWNNYMEDPNFLRQQARSKKEPDEEAKEREVQLKVKLHGLRRQKRRAEYLYRKFGRKIWPPRDQDLYSRWYSGQLGQEIDKLTRLHGYGKLSTGQNLVAPSVLATSS